VRDRIRFLLGCELREVGGVDPTMTVLDWLRGAERRTGTKEGCNEGDCGACTVVIGRLDGERLVHEPVNACIQFLATLDGKHLLTVEDLKASDGTLHPVQRAMVESHGSQCGFCTPGFVMALYAMRLAGAEPTFEAINDALAGNLCRCTGYGPIIEAGRRALVVADPLADRSGDWRRQLLDLQDDAPLALTGPDGRRFFAPTTTDQLTGLLLQHPEATVVAGATDVGLWVTKQLELLDPVVWLGRIEELRRIEETADAIRFGGGVSLEATRPVLARHWPDLGEVMRRFGSVQVRSAGTLGGNVANGSPIGDTMPALIALGAEVVLRRGSERRTLALEDLYTGYMKQDRRQSEFVEAVVVPKPRRGWRFKAWKISKRFDQDISAVCACFSLRLESGDVADIRIGIGGMAAVPARARATEDALRGQPWTEDTVETGMATLGNEFQPIDDMRASARYRLRVTQNLLRKCWLETCTDGEPVRVLAERALARG
jgi:xanthine dehydrogenase small subunit